MSETWKRLLCTWLAALMIISYVPMSVSAEETEQVDMSEPETASETEAEILNDSGNAIQTASEETVIASGVLVSGHSWKIMSDGTLRITGSGAMPSFSQSPWIGYVNSITSIIIDPGTTSIGDYTFYELGKVKTAVIPDTVTSIGEAAFCWCEGLTSIDIPGSVRTIGEDAFWCCLDLVSVTFHEGLQTIEREAFQGCRLITELKFPESLKSIGYWAFGGCSDLVSVEIPGSVEKLDDSVFSGCTSLKTVKLNEGLISIGNSGFAYCFALDTILIPGSVQSIGETAFYQCSQLGTVTFTGNPPVIAESAFAAAVATVRYPSVNTAWSAYAGQQYGGTLSWQGYSVAGHNYANTVVAPTCTEWGYTTHRCTDELCDTYYMDSYQDALGHSWNSGVVSGGTTTFTCVRCGVKRYEYSVSGTCGNNARWTLNTQTGVLRITGTGTITVSYGRNLPWQSYISGIRHVIIEPGITGIGAEAFFECGSIETIEIPNTVKSIGMQAFVWCKSLKEVTIPEGVTSLGESTFWGCESLETLNLPSTLKSIGKKMFYRCDSLKTLVIPDSVTFIDELAFWDCGGITQITVPRSVTKLSEDVFNGCSNLHTVYLPDTLTEIGPGAFSYCSKLKNITIPDSVTYLGETAFFGCSSLRNVMIPGGVTKLERGVFYGCSNMGYLYFTGEPPVFAEDAFQGLSAGIRYPSVLRSAWSQHTSQKYAGSVYWYSYSVTGHNYQNTLVAPTCENRGYTKHTCTDYGCSTYYMDSYTDALGHKWNEGSGSTTMWTYTCTVCGKTRTVYTVGGSCGAYAKWSLNTDEGVLTIYGSGAMSNFSRSSAPWGSYKDSIKKVVIRSGITSVGSYAFYEHSAIESVELPDTIRTLGEASFCWAENLRAIHIPEGVTSIPEDCFWACLSMEEISLPSTLKTIGQGAFYSNQEVTQLDLPAGLTDIGEDAFWQCYGIRSVTIPKGVTILRETVFCSCTSLKTVVLHDNITEIQRSAFNGCSSLTSMTLPKNLKSVGVNALSDIKVSSLTFHDQVEFLDDGVLYGASVKEIHFLGDVPEFDAKAFSGYTGTAYYPRYNQTWTASVRQNYGGSITWKGEGTCPHSYDPFVTPPTCYSQGYTEYICSICGDAYLDDFVDVVDHSYNLTVILPTCTESGYTEYTCTGCGLYYVDDYVSALGHSFEQYVFNNDATCTDDGTKTAKCESCDETDTVTAAGTATGHDYKAVITESTCTEQGYTTHTCTNCGDSYVDSYVDALGHSFKNYVSNGDATCTADGTKTAKCERCDVTDTITDAGTAKGHSFGEWIVEKAATCVDKGTERRDCANCDHFETRGVAATGHHYETVVTDPTCTEQGYTSHTCLVCSDSYIDSYVDATGHNFSQWQTIKDATFTEPGEESRNCEKCSHVEFRAVELTVVTSGNFGAGSTPTDKVTYTLYSNGTMVVEGNGSIFHCDWNGTKQPFIEYRKQIKHLIIGEGITQTTGGCFAHLTNLLTVSFPSTLTKLHNNAFMNSFATSVTEITIPETVSYMGAYSIGHHSGDESAYFTDIILENPNITIADNDAVFNGGAKLNQLTLYSHGTQNNVSAYAAKYGIKYIDLDSYAHGVAGEIEYRFYDGVLTLRAESGNAIVPAGDYPWNDQRKEIQKIVIGDGIVGISDNAFVNYAVLEEVELPDNFQSLGSGAFAVTDGNSVSMSIVIPKRMKSLGENIFAGRSAVNATAYYGSIGAELNEPGVELKLKKVFKLLLIGNSYSEDASCCAQGMKDSMLFDAIQAMLGEDAEVVVGAIISGGKGINWHATQAENGNKSYYFKTMSSKDKTWKSQGSTTSADALAWTDWDAVSLQPYNINVTTGKESVPYPDSTDPKFYHIKDASSYMLDHVTRYAPYADIYFYMHWAQTSSTVLNAALNSYNKSAAFMPQVLNYEGTESGAKFKTIIPVGLSVQNARTTYLALLAYNTTAYADKNLNLKTDAQIGLQRDGGHLSFNIGRYIAGLTFAETIIPMEMRAEGYVLPDIRITESVGRLPKEYTEIAQKSVFAAVESWRNGKLVEVTEIEGYREDPTVAAAEKLAQMTIEIPCALEEASLITKIGELALAELSEDFCVEQVALPEDFEVTEEKQSFTATVTIRFGYTSKDVAVNVALENEHSYESVITAPSCTEAGYSTYTCANCGDSYVDTYVEALGHSFKEYVSDKNATCTADGTKTAKCERCDATDTVTDAGTAKGHSFGDWIVEKAATCVDKGTEHRDCANCDHFETRVIDATGHDYKAVVTEPTCTEQGYTTHTCANCGDTYKDSYVEAAGHSFGDWVVTTEPTCTEKGEERRECENCDHFETRAIDATGHDYKAVVTEPTCTEQGYTTHSCTECGDTYKDSYVDALGHDYGEWETTKEATCEENGQEQRICGNCKEVESRIVEAIGHDYEEVVTVPTCTDKGFTTHTCANCGDKYEDSYVDALGHEFGEWTEVKAPTCTAAGEDRRDCENCDHFETRETEAAGHDYEVTVIEPTCTAQGFTTHTCSNCGDSYVDTYIDALGHDYGDWETTKEATYEEDGEERRECSRCGDEQKRIIPMLTHSYESVVTAPTCTEKGYTTHTCADCGDSYVDTYIDALGHSFKEYVSDKNATCTADGTKTAKCERCEATDTITDAGTAKGHALSDWTVVTQPTCTQKGTERRSCANCDHSESREIVATGHEYEAVITAPTCEAKGYTTHSCTKCEESYVDSYVDAIGHNYGDWQQVKAPTCEETGEETRECANCGNAEKRILDATGHDFEATVTAPTCEEKGYTTHTCANCGDSHLDSYVDALGHNFEDGTCSNCGEPEVKYLPGDVDLDGDVDVDDVLALLWHVLFPDDYPIEVDADFDHNGSTDVDDVLTLLWHVLFPEDYPLN